MSVLNLRKPAPDANAAPTPCADALAAHKRTRKEKADLMQAIGKTDTEAAQVVNTKQASAIALAAMRERRLDLLAEHELGAPNEPEIATLEREIEAAAREDARLEESASVALRKRALLAKTLEPLRKEIEALDKAWSAVKRAAKKERAIALGPKYAAAQRAFLLEMWVEMSALGLVIEREGIVGAPLGSRFAVRDLVLPLPNLPEIKAFEIDRETLFEAVRARADAIEAEVAG